MKKDTVLEKNVIDLYNSGIKNRKAIAKKLGRNYSSIFYVMKRLGLDNDEKEPYKVDEAFFEDINSEQKAYLLGIMYSDGCVHNNTMIIGVSDKEIVDNAKVFLDYEGPIEISKQKEYKPIYKLRVRRKKIFNDLVMKGCSPNKSLTLKFPEVNIVPVDQLNNFIRGIFDGDGCISYSEKYDKWTISITGTKEILDGIRNNIIGIHGCLRQATSNNTWRLMLQSPHDISKFINYIYKNATVSLTRKRILCERFLKEYNESN